MAVEEGKPTPYVDPDDWFAEPDEPRPWWSAEEDAGVRRRRSPLADLTFTLRTLLIAGAVVVVVAVVGVLAISGVFSSSGTKHTTPPVQPTTTAKQTTTPTTPATRTPRTPAPRSTLKPGDTGAQVKVLQRALAKLGYAAGSVDGDYGPSTVAAVKKFQTAAKLTADGVVGPATLRALERALAAKT